MLVQKGALSDSANARKKHGTKRTAIVDIGSNSIRLVVYQGPVRVPAILFNEKVMAGLGKELSTTGAIGKDSMALAVRGLKRFHRLCMEMEVDSIRSFATAAVRDASNGNELLKIARGIGYDVVVLQGEEEAESAALGVISGIPEAKGIVGDLGGGSLGLAMVDQGKVLERFSFPLGVLRVADLRAKGQGALKSQVRKMLKKPDGRNKDKNFLSIWSVDPGGRWPGSTCLTAIIRCR